MLYLRAFLAVCLGALYIISIPILHSFDYRTLLIFLGAVVWFHIALEDFNRARQT